MIFEYDILVIGAGHAGCEAAAAAANLGKNTCLMTMDMNKIAQMSCNPAIGGIAKGQIVREIDALGGYMGIITDKASIQFRMLNRSKGPAMWSPRAQCDRVKFGNLWRETLENIPNLNMWQDCATELLVENGKAVGVKTQMGAEFGHEQNCTNELQPGYWWHSKRTDCTRNRCIGRIHGYHNRQSIYSIPHAQPF